MMTLNQIRSLACTLAYGECQRNGTSGSEAMKFGWAAAKLVADMSRGVVRFPFVKLSTGEVRWASGTLLTGNYTVGLGENWVTFFDVEKEGYRRFSISTLLDPETMESVAA